MITRLRLENFRRHANTDIVLDPTDQIIAVGGPNGAGKSSLLEAITFALFGHGRHGPRQLDSLVRRGGELEGMEVELEFTIGDDRWRIVRRRENKHASAVLFANDVALVEGTKAVNDAVAALLGTDAAGFKLATVAQQKELDALIRMDRTSRVRSLGRLLRLDAVARARDEARVDHRRVADVLAALPEVSDSAAVNVARAEADLAAAKATEAAQRAALTTLDQDLESSASVEAAYQTARDTATAAAATAAAAEEELQRALGALAGAQVGEAPAPPRRDLATITEEAALVAKELSRAEAVAQLVAQRQAVTRERDTASGRLGEVVALLAGRSTRGAMATVDVASGALTLAELTHAETLAAADAARVAHAEARTRAAAARERADAAASLGAECTACGQKVTDDHRHQFADTAEAVAVAAAAELTSVDEAVRRTNDEVTAAAKQVKIAERELAEAEEQLREVTRAESEAAELERRLSVYNDQLDRLPAEAIDLDVLYARQGALAIEETAAREASVAAEAYAQAVARHTALADAVAAATERRDAAVVAVGTNAIADDLVRAWDQRVEVVNAHRQAIEALGTATATVAGASERLVAAKAQQRRDDAAAAKRAQLTEDGTVAALAARVLVELEKRLGANVRPALAGTTSAILDQMSAGRFTDVTFTADFAPLVTDDGSPRPLSELSGGEADLVALAMRLAVAEVVAERNAGGAGFLILDEVFGSQDPSRRDSILTGLRGLRARYGQIWCISHVGGLEDAADRVLDIELDDDGVAHVV